MKVMALAGRRIDAPGAAERFPLGRVSLVRQRLEPLLREGGALVCAAAAGSDLIALDLARELGLRRRVILSSAPDEFRASSVVDRPGDWGPHFDQALADARRTDDLVLLPDPAADDATYLRANELILDEALALAGSPDRVLAVIVWEGQPRGDSDVTAAFARSARTRGVAVREVLTTESTVDSQQSTARS